ncbi:hypothetical protein P4T62_28590 [Bacillus mycoides]|uniref:hypothetical protein n=1 Tax=Bacillus mycoides TaxID=1405 RepID=UPI002E1A9046|nr:hypothetical protein [Bacillus mycoides]
MMQFKHTEEERQFLQDKIAKLKRENGLGSTLESQVSANEHVIKQLEMFMNQKVCVGEQNVYFDPIKEGLNNPDFRFPYAE